MKIMGRYAKVSIIVLTVVVVAITTVILAARLLPAQWNPWASWLIGFVLVLMGFLGALSEFTGYNLRDCLERGHPAKIEKGARKAGVGEGTIQIGAPVSGEVIAIGPGATATVMRALDSPAVAPTAAVIAPIEPPFMVPQDVGGFVGRKKELARSLEALREGRSVGIYGPGGVGKTALAIRACYQLRGSFRDGIVWLDVSPHAPADESGSPLDSLLDRIGRAYGDVTISTLRHPHQRLSAVGRILSGKQALLVLDDAKESQPLRALLGICGPCPLLITSRRHLLLERVELVNLESLPAEEAGHLFCVRANKKFTGPDKDLVASISEIVGGLPLAIELAAAKVKVCDTPVACLMKRLKQATLDELESDDRSVRASFAVTYEDLAPADQTLFVSLGAFEGESFGLEAVRSISGLDQIERRMERLMNLSLVKPLEKGRYKLHPLLRLFAQEKLEDQATMQRMVEYFLKYALDHTDDHDGLDTERQNIFGAMRCSHQMQEWHIVVGYMHAMKDFLTLRGYWTEGLEHARWAVEAADHLSSVEDKARVTNTLAMLYHRQGHWEEARRWLVESHRISRELGDQDIVAEILHNLGLQAQVKGNYQEARSAYEQGLHISRQLSDQQLTSKTLQNLGILAFQQGDYEQARLLYVESLGISRRLGNQDMIASTLHNLGIVAQLSWEYGEAQRLYEESLEISEQLGDKSLIANTLVQLGTLAKDQGEYGEAQRLYEESLNINEQLGASQGIASSLHQLGVLAQAQGKYCEAQRLYEKSLRISEQLGDKSGVAVTLHGLARVAHAQEEYHEAKRLYAESLQIKEQLGDQHGKAITLRQQSLLEESLGNLRQAREFIQTALDIFKRLEVKPQIALAEQQLHRISEKIRDTSQQ